MKRFLASSLFFFTTAILGTGLFAQQPLKLWYDKPANKWVEALPVGNGKIGAMIYGGVDDELIQLNESTLYSGGPVKKVVNPQSASYLPAIRQALLKNHDYGLAEQLTKKMQGFFTESYLPMADLRISQKFGSPKISGYYRDLDITQAIATTRFKAGQTTYKREMFVSAPNNILVVRFTASKPGQLNFKIDINSQLQSIIKTQGAADLILDGQAPAHVDPSYYNPAGREHVQYRDSTNCKGMRFQVRIKLLHNGGKIFAKNKNITVTGANEATLYLTAATSFNGFNKCPDMDGKNERTVTANYLNTALKSNYLKLKRNHVADYRRYFDRVSFQLADSLGKDNRQYHLPTDKRLQSYSNGAYDPFLETLYFQFGRYLLISSSRPGGPPANLQGIWNKELRAPWSSNYTININTEMNYWPAEITALPEMHLPLLDFLRSLSITGGWTAKEFYHARGWVAHHNSDIWATSNPVGDLGTGDPVWANWPMGGAWLCRHLWEHYQFTRDKVFLAKIAYPLMKGAGVFMSDWLVSDGQGHLVTAPSVSPENKFIDSSGNAQGVSVATTMDMSIIWDLFTNLAEASKTLGIDGQFRDSILSKRALLFPKQIGKEGQLMEWFRDFKETDPQHRHTSHLFGLYPGSEITLSQTPELFKAAQRTLEIRGDGGTGWSRGWKINLWARLGDGNHAYNLIRNLLHYTNTSEIEMHDSGGTYPNLFDAHPPFQIDGNFAGTAGMTEMLLQSHEGFINLLPALPLSWKSGSVSGLRARGGFEVCMKWLNHKLYKITVKSQFNQPCAIKANAPLRVINVKYRSSKLPKGYLVQFYAIKGKHYDLVE